MHSRKLMLPVLIKLLLAGQAVQAQTSGELDLTMQVMRDGELPAGLVNRIELPPPEYFAPSVSGLPEDIDDALDLPAQAIDQAESAREVVSDGIRETLSIDGRTPPASTDDVPVVPLPEDIVSIIDDNLPLEDTLENSLEPVLGDGTSVVDAVNDSVEPLNDLDIVDNLTDSIQNVGDSVADSADDILSTLDDPLSSTSQLDNGALQGTQELLDQMDTAVPTTEVTEELVQDLPDSLDSPADIDLQQTLDDLGDAVPGLR